MLSASLELLYHLVLSLLIVYVVLASMKIILLYSLHCLHVEQPKIFINQRYGVPRLSFIISLVSKVTRPKE